ncbi:pilus assembly protein [Desulfallas sp. Bu1-1]|uniref:TadE/TadG family type IV pilus assembly protein n=1 Tax=Desulfallas sp. Bu1-1 TaxID=2787620 RepID=UPI00189EB323|nr:TadE family protein [Desulfallas sp. Bu1-1]MBF7082487.1 pilus assembly protein [Desulfallas sp. Bu1-1]
MRALTKLSRDTRGQALVEFALILPLVILLLMAIFEFGSIFHSYLVITNASRDGARIGIVGEYTDEEDLKQKVKDMCAALDQSEITVDVNSDSVLRRMQVQVTYKVHPFTPVLSAILPDPVVLKSKTTMRIES